MKKILLFISLVFGILFANEYRALDHQSIVYKDANGKGKIDYIALFKATDELYTYARAYPLKFKDEEQKKAAFSDLLKVERVFDFLLPFYFTTFFFNPLDKSCQSLLWPPDNCPNNCQPDRPSEYEPSTALSAFSDSLKNHCV